MIFSDHGILLRGILYYGELEIRNMILTAPRVLAGRHESLKPNFWQDHKNAALKMKEMSDLQAEIAKAEISRLS